MSNITVVLHGPAEIGGELNESQDTLGRINAALNHVAVTGDDLVASGGFSDEAIDFLQDRVKPLAGQDLIIERRSRDTISNGVHTRHILDLLGVEPEKLSLVTADYHAHRAAFIFRKSFSDNISLESVVSPVEHSRPEALKVYSKELILTSIARLAFAGIDMNNLEDREKVLSRAYAIFPSRRAGSTPQYA